MSNTSLDVSKGTANVSVTNKGKSIVYLRLVTTGQPPAGDSTVYVQNNPDLLQMNVTYMDKSGNPLDVSDLKQGTDFVAKVQLINTGNMGTYNELALTQVFPGGWEILNPRMTGTEGSFSSSTAEYQDIRDDRVYTYFDMTQGEVRTYYMQLNATYPGRYYFPGPNVQAMYDNTISAADNGKWVVVSP